jgi:hypothetical protein
MIPVVARKSGLAAAVHLVKHEANCAGLAISASRWRERVR